MFAISQNKGKQCHVQQLVQVCTMYILIIKYIPLSSVFKLVLVVLLKEGILLFRGLHTNYIKIQT